MTDSTLLGRHRVLDWMEAPTMRLPEIAGEEFNRWFPAPTDGWPSVSGVLDLDEQTAVA
jgi:hypothetical protein